MKQKLAFLIAIILPIFFSILYQGVENWIGKDSRSLMLSGEWQICAGDQDIVVDDSDCDWQTIDLPNKSLITKLTKNDHFRGGLKFKKKLILPEICESAAGCALVIGEVGDALEIRVDGRVIGRHGGLPPGYQYKKNYPVNISLVPPLEYHPNQVRNFELIVYSPKVTQAGIRYGPFGIYPRQQADLIEHILVGKNIILPIVAAGILLTIAIVGGLLSAFRGGEVQLSAQFLIFCATAAAFLLSFTEIPREYLDLEFSIYIHFILRFAYDWTYFEAVLSYFSVGGRIRNLRWLYIFGFGVFLFSFVSEQLGFRLFGLSPSDTAFLVMRAVFPMLIVPAVLACYLVWKRGSREPFFLKMTFVLTTLMLLSDVLTFHNVIQMSYFVKFYPALIALALAWGYLNRYFNMQANAEVERQMGQLARQVAHDIRSPLTALKLLVQGGRNSEGHNEILVGVAERIEFIADEILTTYKRRAVPRENSLTDKIRFLILEKQWEVSSSGRLVSFYFWCEQQIQMKSECETLIRILSNLINNSIEAEASKVEIRLLEENGMINFIVSDNGKGMSTDDLELIRMAPQSRNKPGGHGLGLKNAMVTVSNWGGRVVLRSSQGNGTTIEMAFPGR